MKITDDVTINLDLITWCRIAPFNDDLKQIYIMFEDENYYELDDNKYGKGFAERTKAKIDAYFDAKERMQCGCPLKSDNSK